jgi:hypothetical protein
MSVNHSGIAMLSISTVQMSFHSSDLLNLFSVTPLEQLLLPCTISDSKNRKIIMQGSNLFLMKQGDLHSPPHNASKPGM